MTDSHRKKRRGYENVPSSSIITDNGNDGIFNDERNEEQQSTSIRPTFGRKHVQLVPIDDFDDEDADQGGVSSSKLRRRSTIRRDALEAAMQQQDAQEPLETTPGLEASSTRISPAVYIFAACASWNSCILGYDLGVNSLSVMLVQKTLQLSDVQIESYLGILDLFAILGAATASMGHQYLGRRGAFVVASSGFLLGDLIQASARSYTILMVGRAILGVSVGYGLAIDPMYISEIAPAHKRGELVSWSEIAINIGVAFGFASGIVFNGVPDEVAWRYMFGVGALLPLTMLILVKFVMPESPRWLIQQDREGEATQVLARLNPSDHDNQVEALVQSIKVSLEQEEATHEFGWKFLLCKPTPAYRRMLWTGVLAGISQQVVGIAGIGSFLTYIMDRSGIHDRYWQAMTSIGLQTMKTLITAGASSVIDRVGRRPLCFISLAGMTVSLLILSADFAFTSATSNVAVLGLLGYLAFFGVGMGPCAWLIPSEVFTTSVRSKGMSLATLANRLVSTTWASTFLSMEKAITWGGVFLVLAVLCVIMALLIYLYVPETKGKSLEEMAVFFAGITGDRSILDQVDAPNGNTRRSTSSTGSTGLEAKNEGSKLASSIEMGTFA